MGDERPTYFPVRTRRFPVVAVSALAALLVACAVYANLSFLVTKPAQYRFFPPFQRSVNTNMNNHLGAEYLNIAKAMVKGEGFASPFGRSTGPTAWMPPVLPAILAVLLWLTHGDINRVMVAVIIMQTCVLIGTGVLVIAVAKQTTGRLGAWVAATVFFLAVLCDFHAHFQFTHDCWLVMLAVDLLIAGMCWLRPLCRKWTAAAWGLFGGFCALVNPLVALVWGLWSGLLAFRERAWNGLTVAVLAAGFTLLPWTMRNYAVFGKIIPVKSNLAFELYQSQCVQPDGLIQRTTFSHHPFRMGSTEGEEYRALGEIAFLERKSQQFWDAFWADPLEFLDRAANRLLGATVWYVPFDRENEPRQRPWTFLLARLTQPLPFLGLLILVFSSLWRPLHAVQWSIIGFYALYLLPYAVVSYYDRYAFPLLGVKVLLVIWAADRLLSIRRTALAENETQAVPGQYARSAKRQSAVPVAS